MRPCTETPDIDGDDGACLSDTFAGHGNASPKHLRKMVESRLAKRVCHQNNYPRKSSNNVPVFPVCNVEVPLTISYSALWLVVDRRCAVGCATATVREELQC
jgi:hypothetical protein